MKCLVLGFGRLGKEIVKQTKWDFIDQTIINFDFCNLDTYFRYLYHYDTVINCIANTNTYSSDKKSIIDVNFKAVCDLVNYCNKTDKKLIHISSDYIYAGSISNASEEDIPVHAKTWYSYSKLLSDAYVNFIAKDYLLIRTSFKQNPFPYDRAPVDQFGNFDYIETIASIIIRLINLNASGIYNVGTGAKSIYDLAVKTKPNVEKVNGAEIDKNMPLDTTMNLTKLEEFLKEHDK